MTSFKEIRVVNISSFGHIFISSHAQKINVKVLKVDILKNQIDLELVKNEENEAIYNNESIHQILSENQE